MKEFLKRLLIPATITALFYLLFLYSTETDSFGFQPIAKKMRTDIEMSDHLRDSLVNVHANGNTCTKALANQYDYIRLYKKQHLRIAEKFEMYYYSLTLIAVIAAVITGIMGILIGRTGWQNQSLYMREAFIGFAFCATLTVTCINVFNNAENSNKNITKYFYFTNLQTNIYDVMAIPDSLNNWCSDGKMIKIFNENNKSIKDNMNLFLDIKADKIPTPDVGSALGK